jgi:hypothetical protein
MFQIVNMTMDFEYNLYVNVTNARNVWQNLSGNNAEKMNASSSWMCLCRVRQRGA